MKTIHKILLVTAAAASFTLVNRAGEVVMPPRAWDNLLQTESIPRVNNDPNLFIYPSYDQTMPPRTLQQLQESATTGNYDSHRDPDLVSQNAALPGTPKQKQFTEEQE